MDLFLRKAVNRLRHVILEPESALDVYKIILLRTVFGLLIS
jgi:hypothetical protein